jgi:hypothetical protein
MNRARRAARIPEGKNKAELLRATVVVLEEGALPSMMILALTVLLAAIGVVVMPYWRHSASWGYGPGAGIGLLLVGIGIFAVTGQAGGSEALGKRLAMPAKSTVMIEASAVDTPRPEVIALME